MTKLYVKAPVVEVACEFRFEPVDPWDATVPGRVYERLKDRFPLRRATIDFSASIVAGPDRFEQRLRPTEKIQFLRNDETALVQVAVNTLTVNQLQPYPGWETLRLTIQEVLGEYTLVIPSMAVQRIGLRYINRIPAPEMPLNLEQYFDFYPHIGAALPDMHTEFFMTLAFPQNLGRDKMRVSLSAEPPSEVEENFINLDIDYFLDVPGAVPIGSEMDWTEQAHSAVKSTFEGAIKPELRTTFGAEEVP